MRLQEISWHGLQSYQRLGENYFQSHSCECQFLAGCGPEHPLSVVCHIGCFSCSTELSHDMALVSLGERSERQRERDQEKSFYNLIWKWHSIISVAFYWFEAGHEVQPTFKDRRAWIPGGGFGAPSYRLQVPQYLSCHSFSSYPVQPTGNAQALSVLSYHFVAA